VSIALQEDVAVVGLSILSGAHVALTTRTVDSLWWSAARFPRRTFRACCPRELRRSSPPAPPWRIWSPECAHSPALPLPLDLSS
jgi:hypothetical protein